MKNAIHKSLWFLLTLGLFGNATYAHIGLPAIFSSNMVLQQKQANKVWGWGDAGDTVKVTIDGQQKETKVGDDGSWAVMLD